jgi:hypothetical protein
MGIRGSLRRSFVDHVPTRTPREIVRLRAPGGRPRPAQIRVPLNLRQTQEIKARLALLLDGLSFLGLQHQPRGGDEWITIGHGPNFKLQVPSSNSRTGSPP